MDPQATEQIKNLWMALGVFLATNFGLLLKLYLGHRKEQREKEEKAKEKEVNAQTEALQKLTIALELNTRALTKFENDLERFFTALKLVAGKKWSTISQVITKEHPKNQ